MKIFNDTFQYDGELDKYGKATGEGTATRLNNTKVRIVGTFLNDQLHGFCE